MVVTLDFICLRLNPESGLPEVMLQERQKGPESGRYALVGGWVREEPASDGGDSDETLGDAVTRILKGKVGFLPSHLEKLPPEGSVTRDASLGWSVTIPFLCLFNRPDMAELDQQDGIKWEPIESILAGEYPLPFDHRKLVNIAYEVAVGMPVTRQQLKKDGVKSGYRETRSQYPPALQTSVSP